MKILRIIDKKSHGWKAIVLTKASQENVPGILRKRRFAGGKYEWNSRSERIVSEVFYRVKDFNKDSVKNIDSNGKRKETKRNSSKNFNKSRSSDL